MLLCRENLAHLFLPPFCCGSRFSKKGAQGQRVICRKGENDVKNQTNVFDLREVVVVVYSF